MAEPSKTTKAAVKKANVKEEAKANGVPEAEYASITADRDPNQGEAGDDNDLTTLLTKFWREDGRIFAVKATETVAVRKKWDTGLTLYPIAWMPWGRKALPVIP